MKTTLAAIAHSRSGDKGNHANIALFAYNRAAFDWIAQNLTAGKVKEIFRETDPCSRVERFDVPNLLAFNYLLYEILDGGASRSLHIDTQGKSLGYRLLLAPIDIPDSSLTIRVPREELP